MKQTTKKPWGKFEQFCLNTKATVKIITVNPNSELSLQTHENRDEFWKIISGEGNIVIGEKTHHAKTEDEFFIPKKAKHQAKTLDSEMKILEISYGEFDENDIIRLKDKYGRI